MGRGSSKVGGSGLVSKVADDVDFNSFVRKNMSNPEFKQFGRDNGMPAVKDLWYQKRHDEEIKNLKEIPIEDAVNIVRDSISGQTFDNWFREANSGVKPKLTEMILNNHGTLNAGMNIAYNNYKEAGGTQSFNKWLITPQKMYRGTHGQTTVQSDVFTSYTPDKSVAQGFAKGSNGRVAEISIRPIDTLGSYQTNTEYEFLILTPKKRIK